MWEKVKFADIFDFQKKSKCKAGNGLDDGLYPFFTSSDVQKKSLNEFHFDRPSLIFGTGGQASVHFCKSKFAVSTDCFVVHPKAENIVTPDFIYYYLNGNIHILEKGFKGAGLRHISKEYLANIELPLPPLTTQQHIASILDHADNLRKLNKQLLQKYDELAQSVFIEMFGDPVRNEKGWEKKKIKDIVLKIENGWSPVCIEEPRKNQAVPAVVKLGAVSYRNFNPNENKTLPQNLPFKEELEIKQYDLLFSRKNTYDLVGACVYVFETPGKLMIPDTIFRFIYDKTIIMGPYLWMLFNDSNFRKLIQSLASGSSGSMPNISKAKLFDFEIPVPSIDKQVQFEKMIINIESQKNTLRNEFVKTENIFQSLMQRTFKEK